MRDARTMAGRTELLVDDALTETREGLSFRLNPPAFREISLQADRPWEGNGSLAYASVVELGDRYALYYRATPQLAEDTSPEQYLCVAFSTDGIRWEKPELGLCEFGGSTGNNILLSGRRAGVICHNFTPCLDTNPACPPEERIKAVGGYAPEGLFVFVSGDGLSFRRLCRQPAAVGELLDSQNVLLWDGARGVYRLYSRYWQGGADGVRAIESRTSPDCIRWSDPVRNRYTGMDEWEHLYTNAVIPCPGAEQLLLSTPMRFVPHRVKLETPFGPGISDAVLMTSRDGHSWDRRFPESWVSGGSDPRCWTQRSQMPARGALRFGGEFSFYVTTHYCHPDAQIRRYTVPEFRLASLRAGAETGVWVTKPLLWSGEPLCLNYATAAVGSIVAEVLDAESYRPIPGFTGEACGELFGDVSEEPVTFSGADWSRLAGQVIRLRFRMRLAELYALRG